MPRKTQPQPNDSLTATEALYGFAAWLSTREEVTIISAAHNFGTLARTVEDFVAANGLQPVRSDWGSRGCAVPSCCRVCGCTDSNACVDATGLPCSWRESDLCSSCAVRPSVAKVRKIVCLCGSTRFLKQFLDEQWRLTLEDTIVLSIGVWRDGPAHHAGEHLGESVKRMLDLQHLAKIDMAHSIRVLNVDGYVGESTQREIAYAIYRGKPITWLNELAGEAYLEKQAHALGALVAKFSAGRELPTVS